MLVTMERENVEICMCYLGHLWAQVDLFQVDSLRQKVIEQLAEQHAISQSLSQVTHLAQHTHTKLKVRNQDVQVCEHIRHS